MKHVHTAGIVAFGAAIVAGLVACGGGSSHVEHFHVTALVSDGNIPAAHIDANLKNPWGIAFNPKGFVWVADNGTQKATLYDGNGVPQSLVVSIPAGSSGDANPTGIVFNGTAGFVVSQNGKTGPAVFIFAGEGGTLTAWSPTVNPTAAVTVFDSGGSAVYKGLAMASSTAPPSSSLPISTTTRSMYSTIRSRKLRFRARFKTRRYPLVSRLSAFRQSTRKYSSPMRCRMGPSMTMCLELAWA